MTETVTEVYRCNACGLVSDHPDAFEFCDEGKIARYVLASQQGSETVNEDMRATLANKVVDALAGCFNDFVERAALVEIVADELSPILASASTPQQTPEVLYHIIEDAVNDEVRYEYPQTATPVSTEEDMTPENNPAFRAGLESCRMHRCAQHYAVPQQNTNESSGAECGACIRAMAAIAPEVGESRLCLVCAYEKPWGIWDAATGASVCVECRDMARATPPQTAAPCGHPNCVGTHGCIHPEIPPMQTAASPQTPEKCPCGHDHDRSLNAYGMDPFCHECNDRCPAQTAASVSIGSAYEPMPDYSDSVPDQVETFKVGDSE